MRTWHPASKLHHNLRSWHTLRTAAASVAVARVQGCTPRIASCAPTRPWRTACRLRAAGCCTWRADQPTPRSGRPPAAAVGRLPCRTPAAAVEPSVAWGPAEGGVHHRAGSRSHGWRDGRTLGHLALGLDHAGTRAAAAAAAVSAVPTAAPAVAAAFVDCEVIVVIIKSTLIIKPRGN